MDANTDVKMLDVTVIRSQWYRGKGSSGSALLVEHPDRDEMCCLGFVALKVGLTTDEIRGRACPSNVMRARQEMFVDSVEEPDPLPAPLMALTTFEENTDDWIDNDACDTLTGPNDDPDIDDVTREEQLTVAGAAVGINFTFTP